MINWSELSSNWFEEKVKRDEIDQTGAMERKGKGKGKGTFLIHAKVLACCSARGYG